MALIPSQEPWQRCGICSKSFSAKRAFEKHLESATHLKNFRQPPPAYPCPDCNKSFSRADGVKRHRMNPGQCSVRRAPTGRASSHSRKHVLSVISNDVPRKNCKNDGLDAPGNGMNSPPPPTEIEQEAGQEIVKSDTVMDLFGPGSLLSSGKDSIRVQHLDSGDHAGPRELEVFDYQVEVNQAGATGIDVHASVPAERLQYTNDGIRDPDASTAPRLLSLPPIQTKAADISEDERVTLRGYVRHRENTAARAANMKAMYTEPVDPSFLFPLPEFREPAAPICTNCHQRHEVESSPCNLPNTLSTGSGGNFLDIYCDCGFCDDVGTWDSGRFPISDLLVGNLLFTFWARGGYESRIKLSEAISSMSLKDEHDVQPQTSIPRTSTLSGMSATYGPVSLYQRRNSIATQNTKSSGPEIPAPFNTALDEELREARKKQQQLIRGRIEPSHDFQHSREQVVSELLQNMGSPDKIYRRPNMLLPRRVGNNADAICRRRPIRQSV